MKTEVGITKLEIGTTWVQKIPDGFLGLVPMLFDGTNQMILLCMPEPSQREIEAINNGQIRVGLQVDGTAINFLTGIADSTGAEILVYDHQIDVRNDEGFVAPTKIEETLHSLVSVVAVDSGSSKIVAMRAISFPPKLMSQLNKAVLNQASSADINTEASMKWLRKQPIEHVKTAEMHVLGS